MNIDTLTIARELRAADLSEGQAEAIAAAIGRSAGESMEHAATKGDIAQLRTEIENNGLRLEAKIESTQTKLIMWFVGTQLAFVALLGAMLKF